MKVGQFSYFHNAKIIGLSMNNKLFLALNLFESILGFVKYNRSLEGDFFYKNKLKNDW